ncbi:MAG: hypothetical protein N3A38_08870 [Planctomycetota bacterium]|nr:hypothetical protein [Planctomycetota bacterium]
MANSKMVSAAFLVLVVAAIRVHPGEAKKLPDPVTEDERKKLIDAETPEQKKLREELKAIGGKIYFDAWGSSAGGGVFVVSLDGGDAKKVTKIGGYPHVSPDGKKLVTHQWHSKARPEEFLIKKLDEKAVPLDQRNMEDRVAWIMNIDGSDPKPLGYMWDPHWSPDGKRVAGNLNMKGRGGRPIAVFDLEKMEERVVSPPNWPNFNSRGFATYTPDGRWIISGNQRFVAIPLDGSGLAMPSDGKPVLAVSGSGAEGCNQEVSPDGNWLVWVIDTYGEAGAWIYYGELALPRAGNSIKARLGWQDKSVNYDPCFSPDGKYMAYMHGECVPGKRSYDSVPSEIYVTRFPPDGVNVRVTWLNGCARHPHWVTGSGAWK